MFLKKTILFLLMGLSFHAVADAAFDNLILKKKEIGSKAFTDGNYHPGIVKHVVIFKYKEGVTTEQKKTVVRKFLELQHSRRTGERQPYIISITTGAQNSGEKASLGFEQAFIVTFRSEGDRNYYVGAPLIDEPEHYDKYHAGFKKFVGPLLAESNGVMVFDFSVNK